MVVLQAKDNHSRAAPVVPGAPLIPWSTASLFILGVLKVRAAFYALTGIFLLKKNEDSSKEEGN